MASLVLLLVVLPVIPFVIVAIKLDSKGPVLYRQKRVGRGGVTFYCYKFRTMRQDAEADTGPTWAGDDDPRITRIGKFMRSSRLDEIPQLWNVVKGDMAFAGPRPERPEFVEWLTKEIPYYPVRHVVRPGITGWAQVKYKYGNTIEDAQRETAIRLVLHQERLDWSRSNDHVPDGEDCAAGTGRAMTWVFWGAAAFIVYVYAGYPCWLWVRGYVSPRPVKRGNYLPAVSIVIVARNEERVIADKLRNLLELNYPAGVVPKW